MEKHFAVSHGARPELAWLPGLWRSLERHVNHYRRSNDIFPRDTTDKATVVGILAVVPHDKVAVSRDFVGSSQFVSPAGSKGVVLGELLPVDPHGAIVNVDGIPRQADHALHPIRRLL